MSQEGCIPAPQSLDELHDLPAEDFHRVERYLWGDKARPGKVIDHIIELADAEVHWRGRENANTLRDFWYNPTKPIVERVFPDSGTELANTLSKRLSSAVEDGEVTYRSLNILDDSRKRDLYTTSVESDRLLFVEKRSAYQKLRPLAEVYELSLVSGGGQAATAMIEDVVRQLTENSATGGKLSSRGTGDGCEVFLLTDYDPSGFQIGESFVERCRILGLPIKSVQRIGISPDHLPDETLARQRYEPPATSGRERAWLDEHGIEGAYGLEIEAVGDRNRKGEALRRLVVDAISERLRVDERRERDIAKAKEQLPPEAANRVANDLIEDIYFRLVDEARDALNRRGDITLNAYDVDRLHDGAVSGRPPKVTTKKAEKRLEEILHDKIGSGEIPVGQLLRSDGGRSP